jgi:hypothetical protein
VDTNILTPKIRTLHRDKQKQNYNFLENGSNNSHYTPALPVNHASKYKCILGIFRKITYAL